LHMLSNHYDTIIIVTIHMIIHARGIIEGKILIIIQEVI
jgi:hypothetical protein